jgi:putative restriction endonuclease
MDPATHDVQLRQAAFDQVNRLAALRGGILDSADLAGGFDFGGERIPLINPQRGIFKPRQVEHLWLPKIASGLAQLPRWAILISG